MVQLCPSLYSLTKSSCTCYWILKYSHNMEGDLVIEAGQILHEDGNKASVGATIKDKEGKIKGAIFEAKSIVDDFQYA